MNYRLIKYFSVFLVLLFAFSTLTAENWKHDKDTKRNNTLYKPNGEPVYTKFNINNISTWIKNDGETDINQNGNSGFVFPKGSNKAAIFQSGFLWGGVVDGEKRVNGSVYRQGTLPGKILNSGVQWQQLNAEDPEAANVRIYRVRPDYKTSTLESEINDGDGTYEEVYAQYEKDWMEWPASDGAPYDDVDSNGTYDPNIDVPGVPGADQTIWFVANDTDLDQSEYMYGSAPIGIEEQVTVWGYARTGALGNMLFRKFLIINKSNSTVEDMYVSMWSDPDVGDASDDYVGSDTTLSLGYAYNANSRDATYGPTPPAAGFDFFQGPIVDGDPDDEAIFKGKKVLGKKNLPMTAFYFFINSDPIYTDPEQGKYQGTIEFYNLFQGRVSTTGEPFTDPWGNTTKYTLSGNPITGEGWVDGMQHPPGDRRMGMASGPFVMAPGDTQEVVVAEIAAGAFGTVDRRGAIDLLKFYDLQAQLVYDNFFQVAAPPSAPKVQATPFDGTVVLNWGWDETAVKSTESHNSFGYKFEGYNIYQLPNKDATIEDAKRIATFDAVNDVLKIVGPEFDTEAGVVLDKVLQFGSDTGIKRYLTLESDAFTGLPLVNGQRYYYAVTSYAYNDDPEAVPNVLENPVQAIEVVPQSTDPGERNGLEPASQIEVTHATGASDGEITINVVDPTETTGHNYVIRFTAPEGESVADQWELVDETTGQVVYTSSNFSGIQGGLADSVDYSPIVDGLSIGVAGPPLAVKNWDYEGTRWISGTNFGFEALFGGLTVGANFFGSNLPPADFVPVELRWVGGDDALPPSEAKGWSQGAVYWRSDGYAYHGKGWIPFTAWDISDPDNPVQINVSFVEDADAGTANNLWDMGWNGEAFAETGGREYTFINLTPYNPDLYNAENDGTFEQSLYAIGPGARGTHPYLEAPFTMTIEPNYVILTADTYTFSAPATSFDKELAKEDIEKINVFPNPYYGVNPQEINKYQRFVTFNHLPEKATVRILNLAGQLVRTIEKDDPSQFLRWDLMNDSGLPVASGLYIVYVDMPEIGATKVLKAAIIQEQQILDRF